MAEFGVDLYGGTTYGAPAPAQDFKITPFTAVPNGYNSLTITWNSPTGSWTEQRLVKSKTGYPVSPDDGMVVLSSSGAANTYVDVNLQDGTWYYYALWMNTPTGWQRGGVCSGLSVGPKKMQDLLIAKIPEFFKYVPKTDVGQVTWEPSSANILNPDSLVEENTTLKDFIGVLGWGLDYLQDYHQTLMWATDAHQMHIEDLSRLAATFGIPFEQMVNGNLMRKRVLNAGTLAKQGGTLEGLRGVVADTVGWDTSLSITPNLFLTEEQSTFTAPQYPLYDPTVTYAVGQVISYQGYTYQMLAAATAGTAPPTAGASNSTWSNITASQGTTDSSGVLTATGWSLSYNAATLPLGQSLALALSGLGKSAQVDGTALNTTSNSLQIQRGGSGSMPSYCVLLGSSTTSSKTPVTPLIPLPQASVWDASVEYNAGDYVIYDGLSWCALRQHSGITPAGSASTTWTKTGIDTRIPMQFSAYTYADVSGLPAPLLGVAFYDAYGNYIESPIDPFRLAGSSRFTPGYLFYDTLKNHGTSLVSGSTGDIDFVNNPSGTMTWSTVGTWSVDDGELFVTPGAGSSTASVTVPANRMLLNNSSQTAVSFTVPYWDSNQSVAIKYTGTGGSTATVTLTRTSFNGTTVAPAFSPNERITLVWDDNQVSTTASCTLQRQNGTTQKITIAKPTSADNNYSLSVMFGGVA